MRKRKEGVFFFDLGTVPQLLPSDALQNSHYGAYQLRVPVDRLDVKRKK